MPVQGRLVSAFYKSKQGEMPKIYMTVRVSDDKKVFVEEPIISPIRPYFYIRDVDQELVEQQLLLQGLQRADFDMVQTDLDFGMSEGKAVRCDLWEPWRVGNLKRWFREHMGVELSEADIPYIRRLRIDLAIKAGIHIDDFGHMKAYDGPLPKLRLLFIDIEVDDSKGFPEEAGAYAVLCIGTTNDKGEEKYFTWEWGKTTEIKMFKDFFEYAKDYDHLVVWNKDFEGEQLPKRCKKLGLWLEWRIWRLLDLAEFFRMFQLETHYEKLPKAYSRILKKYRGKLDKLGIVKYEKIDRLPEYYYAWKNLPDELERVNQSHSYALFVMESAMEILDQYSGVADEVGMFPDFTTMNSHIVDTLALRFINESNKKWVIPSTRAYRKKKGFRGAAVFPPKRGIHPFVFLFDFTSLYNRIIQSYLLDPIAYYHWNGTFTEDGVDAYLKYARMFGEVYGVNVEFEEEDGTKRIERLPIFPAILHQIEARRNYLKAQRKKYPYESPMWNMYNRQQASAKVVLLACYGVLGMSSSRWTVDKEIPEDMMLIVAKDTNPQDLKIDFRIPNIAKERFAGMITHLARTALSDTKDFFDEDENVEVIYGDTDSNFVMPLNLISPDLSYKTLTEKDMELLVNFGEEYVQKLEDFYKGRFESGIEMKLEKIMDRAVFGKVKKQYYCRVIWDEDAGWQKDEDGNLTWYEYTKGLPLVRTDRTEFLKTYQRKTLQTMLDSPEELYPMWRDTIRDYYNNKFDHMLILRIGVKMRLDQYKSITPVIRAARKLEERGQKVRLGEKVAFIMIDAIKGKGVSEPIDETLPPEEAVAQYSKLTKAALDLYWNKRIWKNIKPFLELVLEDKEVLQIELVKDGLVMLDQWIQPKTQPL